MCRAISILGRHGTFLVPVPVSCSYLSKEKRLKDQGFLPRSGTTWRGVDARKGWMARRGMLSRSCQPTNLYQHHGHSTTSSLRVTIAASCGCVARARWTGPEGAKGFFSFSLLISNDCLLSDGAVTMMRTNNPALICCRMAAATAMAIATGTKAAFSIHGIGTMDSRYPARLPCQNCHYYYYQLPLCFSTCGSG
jgi:hypothetical protein